MAVLVAPRLRARFEVLGDLASLEDWCALADEIERAAIARYAFVEDLKKRIASHEQGDIKDPAHADARAAADEALADIREIEALGTEVIATIHRLRGDVTRELG